jgi:hypothetical protein
MSPATAPMTSDAADLPARRAERPSEADLGAALQDADDHDVRDPDRAHQERDGAETEEQAVDARSRRRLGDERVRWLTDVDLARAMR